MPHEHLHLALKSIFCFQTQSLLVSAAGNDIFILKTKLSPLTCPSPPIRSSSCQQVLSVLSSVSTLTHFSIPIHAVNPSIKSSVNSRSTQDKNQLLSVACEACLPGFALCCVSHRTPFLQLFHTSCRSLRCGPSGAEAVAHVLSPARDMLQF